jgi:SNF2 family DNA or RNA helicase
MTLTTQATSRKSLEPWLLDSVDYYPHQVTGVRQLLRWNSFLLADDMGLGKSLEALTVFAADVKTGASKICLIVCPVSLRANWADEIEKFTRIPYVLLGEEYNSTTGKMRTLQPNERTAQIVEFVFKEGPRILILNYDQVVAHRDELNIIEADIIIFDEAHALRGVGPATKQNPTGMSQRVEACLAIKARRSFVLTGTPVLNQVNELWPLLNRIAPKHFPNYYQFVNRFCVFGGFKDKQIVGVKNQKQLQEILNQIMLRRLKKDTLDLPEVQVIQIPVYLHPTQAKIYQQIDEEMKLENVDPNAEPFVIQNALTQFLRLVQVCGTPATLGYPDESYKLDRVVADAGEVVLRNNSHLVLFTQSRQVLACTMKRLYDAGIPAMELHGDIQPANRQPLVKAWSAARPSALVCMIQVAGEGLNMIKARHAFFIDKKPVPGLNQQAIDRLHRIGQQKTQPVQIREYITRGTIEDRIEQILRTKRKTFDTVIEGVATFRQILQALREQS